jgi:HK97 family phage prohead protease
MKKFFQLQSKSFEDNGVGSYRELWNKKKSEGYQGLSLDVAMSLEKTAEGKSYHVIFSSAIDDRHGEVVEQEFDTKGFKKNPVVVDSHDYWTITSIVGRVLNIGVKEGKLQGDIEFAIKNPKGMIAQDLADGGFLNATSIGFIPLEFSEDGRKILKSELLEISVVSVPANKEALFDRKGMEDEDEENPDDDEKELDGPTGEDDGIDEPEEDPEEKEDSPIEPEIKEESVAEKRKKILYGIATNVRKMNEDNLNHRKRKIFQGIREALELK